MYLLKFGIEWKQIGLHRFVRSIVICSPVLLLSFHQCHTLGKLLFKLSLHQPLAWSILIKLLSALSQVIGMGGRFPPCPINRLPLPATYPFYQYVHQSWLTSAMWKLLMILITHLQRRRTTTHLEILLLSHSNLCWWNHWNYWLQRLQAWISCICRS